MLSYFKTMTQAWLQFDFFGLSKQFRNDFDFFGLDNGAHYNIHWKSDFA